VPGFLDSQAPSKEAEYVRFLEGDIFGKYLFKSYLTHVVGLQESSIGIPIGKWGDIGAQHQSAADASVLVHERWLSVEIKLARLNIANKTHGQTQPNWAFNNILHSPSKAKKQYDLLFAVGVNVLGFENPRYWQHMKEAAMYLAERGVVITPDVLPHQPEFLHLCGAFVMPLSKVPTNHFRVTLRALPASPFNEHFSWLGNSEKARILWARATAAASERHVSQVDLVTAVG